MNILSLYTSLPSTVAISIDGRIIAATHEERFTRQKNDECFPYKSIEYCMSQSGLEVADLHGVAIASHLGFSYEDTVTRKSQWTPADYLQEMYRRWLPLSNGELDKKSSLLDIFPEKIDLDIYPNQFLREIFAHDDRELKLQSGRKAMIAKYLGCDESIVRHIEHHRCHAAYSYYASPYRGEKVLALTVDGSGDGLNSTIGVFDENGNYTRHYQTAECNIGRIYRYMTLLLGMKPNEHEFKVMGLAPYGKKKHAEKALDVFRSTLYVDGVEFKWREKPTDSYFWFKERLEGVRFDSIAFALQTWVEELLMQWVANSVEKFQIKTVVLAGGVAMNIKAMGKIAALSCVEKLFIGGSASDESMAIGASICLEEDMTKELGKKWDSRNIPSLPHLYLGPEASQDLEEKLIEGINITLYDVIHTPSSNYIAELLVNEKILARCTGRMEFGQRSLGNRSILADPSNLQIKEKINAAVKSRDFWMPFAPVVMDRFVDKYLINPKRLESPHMTIGFETTREGYAAMIAACHPGDRTARAQILHEEANPGLYAILQSFEALTGRGALLNTSFNLHGYPIVNTPEEAFFVLENSGLDGLILNDYLIIKKSGIDAN